MTLYVGAILKLEGQPDGQQRTFKVLELSNPHYDDLQVNEIIDGAPFKPVRQTQLVRLEIVE